MIPSFLPLLLGAASSTSHQVRGAGEGVNSRHDSEQAQIILQAGAPRTGTTFQFQVLCATMCLAHLDDDAFVDCEYVTPFALANFSANFSTWSQSSTKRYKVLKTHNLQVATSARDQMRFTSQLFVTAQRSAEQDPKQKGWESFKKKLEDKWNTPIRFVQLYDDLLLLGHALAFEYGQIFNLNQEHIHSLVAYIRYWEILRRCCGAQMSATNRMRLKYQPSDDRRMFSQKLDVLQQKRMESVDEIGRDMCEGFDIAGIERLVVDTYVFRQCGSRISRIRQASARDLPFDGTYCARAEVATAKHDLHFNDPRYLTLLNPALHEQAEFLPNCSFNRNANSAIPDPKHGR